MMSKKIKKTLYFFLFAICFLIIVTTIILKSQKKESEKNLDRVSHIKFEGEVYKKKSVFSNQCLIQLINSKSNINQYDPRNNYSSYFCVINFDTIELVSGFCNEFLIGEKVIFDGETISILSRNGAKKKEFVPQVYTFQDNFEIIKKLHDL